MEDTFSYVSDVCIQVSMFLYGIVFGLVIKDIIEDTGERLKHRVHHARKK